MTTSPVRLPSARRAPMTEIRRDAQLYARTMQVQSLLNALPDVFLVLNDQRQTIYANDACLNLLKMTGQEEVLGQRPGELLDCVHATETSGGCGTTEHCQYCGALKAILGGIAGEKVTHECRITLRNGDALDLRASACPIEMEDRRFVAFTVSDISGEKRRRALERIFFHDVLNTASSLTLTTELLRSIPDIPPKMATNLDVTAHRLVDEIRSQQMLATAEIGELRAEMTEFNVFQFVDGIVQQYANHQLSSGRQLKLEGGDQALMIRSDRTILGRVIGNMIKNALEATHSGGTVSVSCIAENNRITFAVHNPTFMPQDVQLQVFNRSFSTKGQGRGLGTYSMRLLSERYLDGSVRFESSQEQGTTFFANYPIAM